MELPGVTTERAILACPPPLHRLALSLWTSPVWAGLASSALYAALAILFNPNGLGQSSHPYYVYLADGFLHGQLGLAQTPPTVHDLSVYQGRYYLYWPPFPAFLFVPLVALFGIGISDALLTLAVAGLNVALVSLLLASLNERNLVDLPGDKRAWLTAFFAFGTVHLTLAPYSRVWFTGQLIGFALLCGAYLAVLRAPGRWAPFLSGTLLACAFLTRNSLALAGIWIAWFLLRQQRGSGVRAALKIVLSGLAPIALAAALLGGYDYLRFGNVFETGFLYQQWDPLSRGNYDRYGAFSLQYLPTNLFYYFVAVPYLAWFGERPAIDFWMGGSLFLMSPLFLLAIPGALRSWRSHGWALALSCVAGLAPALLLQGTGWIQFGSRYTLDVTVPLLMAAALGAARVPTTLIARLSMLSMAVYLPGAVLLGRVVRP